MSTSKHQNRSNSISNRTRKFAAGRASLALALAAAAALEIGLSVAGSVHAADLSDSWTGTSGVLAWDNSVNWNNGIPNNGSGNAYNVTIPATSARVNLDGTSETIGSLNFLSGSTGFITNAVSPSARLIIDPSSLTTQIPTTIAGNIENTGGGGEISLIFGSGAAVSQNATVSGEITGNVSVTVDELGGMVTLSGANAFTGGTTVNSGTLSIASDSNLGATSGGVTLGGGTLDYTGLGGTTNAIDNAMTITGSTSNVLENTGTGTGTGTEVLSGSISNTGGTLIFSGGTFKLAWNSENTGGTFQIGGASSSSVIASTSNSFGDGYRANIMLMAGSTLETFGAAGESTTDVNINGGSFSQQAGSTLKLLVTAGGNDLVNISNGTATLNGTLDLIFSGFTPIAGQKYTVILTENETGVTGQFSAINLQGTAPSLLKGTGAFVPGTGDVVTLSYSAFFANLSGFTPNEQALAAYLNANAVLPNTPPAIQNVLITIAADSPSQQAAFLDSLTPQAYSGLSEQSIQNNTFLAQQVFNQVQNAFDGGGFRNYLKRGFSATIMTGIK